jgi:hypothetical protein
MILRLSLRALAVLADPPPLDGGGTLSITRWWYRLAAALLCCLEHLLQYSAWG